MLDRLDRLPTAVLDGVQKSIQTEALGLELALRENEVPPRPTRLSRSILLQGGQADWVGMAGSQLNTRMSLGCVLVQ